MKNKFLNKIVAIVLVSFLPTLGLAHHSSSEFTAIRIELEGTLLQVNWRNPHPSLTFQSAATAELWNIQLPGTIEALSEKGITANSFEIGQSVKIAGLTSNRIEHYLQGTNVLFSNGSELVLKQGVQPRWTQAVEVLSEVMPVAEPTNLAINYKLIIILSLFTASVVTFSLSFFKKKNIPASSLQ